MKRFKVYGLRFTGVGFLMLLLALPLCGLSQPRPMGVIEDDEAYNATPLKADLLTRSYASLPPSFSLRAYCPTPQDQGQFNTCSGWAAAYAARTIMEAYAEGIVDPEAITQMAFSPTFLYTKIKSPDDIDCQNGAKLSDAMKLLHNMGICKKTTFFENCTEAVPLNALLEASNYKIKEFSRLFSTDATPEKKVEKVKMALSQGRPVVISMECYSSFFNCGELWNGVTGDPQGKHAMCVVGYDDNKYGGAVQIMNSWGTNWADGGFVWVKYEDFARHTNYGYEMRLEERVGGTKPVTLAGALDIKLTTGSTMPVKLVGSGSSQFYSVPRSYPSGTHYRIFLSNHEPAYVYVLGADAAGSLDLLFPPTPDVSPSLDYSSNDIAIPSEEWYIETDNTVGTDYLCILYSRNALDIQQLMGRIRTSTGPFSQRVENALGNLGISGREINFERSQVKFSTRSAQPVLPVIVEIPHSR